MSEQLVYSVLENGSDKAAIGGLIAFFVLVGAFTWFSLVLRRAQREGLSLASRSRRTTGLRTLVANNALLLITVIWLAGAGLTFAVWKRYESDRKILESGDFQTWSGSLDQYVSAKLTQQSRPSLVDQVGGIRPTLHEQDRLVVSGRAFLIACDKLPDRKAAPAGEEGSCIELHPGQQVRIDYIQISPTQYRAEPLRIWVLQ